MVRGGRVAPRSDGRCRRVGPAPAPRRVEGAPGCAIPRADTKTRRSDSADTPSQAAPKRATPREGGSGRARRPSAEPGMIHGSLLAGAAQVTPAPSLAGGSRRKLPGERCTAPETGPARVGARRGTPAPPGLSPIVLRLRREGRGPARAFPGSREARFLSAPRPAPLARGRRCPGPRPDGRVSEIVAENVRGAAGALLRPPRSTAKVALGALRASPRAVAGPSAGTAGRVASIPFSRAFGGARGRGGAPGDRPSPKGCCGPARCVATGRTRSPRSLTVVLALFHGRWVRSDAARGGSRRSLSHLGDSPGTVAPPPASRVDSGPFHPPHLSRATLRASTPPRRRAAPCSPPPPHRRAFARASSPLSPPRPQELRRAAGTCRGGGARRSAPGRRRAWRRPMPGASRGPRRMRSCGCRTSACGSS